MPQTAKWRVSSDRQKIEMLREDMEALLNLHKDLAQSCRAEFHALKVSLTAIEQAIARLTRQLKEPS